MPFGAKDSELCGWEYKIPEGMEAVVENGKVIVRRKESEDERIRMALIKLMTVATDKQPISQRTIDICSHDDCPYRQERRSTKRCEKHKNEPKLFEI